MKSWKDVTVAAIGVSGIVLGYIILIVFEWPHPELKAEMDVISPGSRLYPSCDHFPHGVDGIPCIDADELARTGKLVFHSKPID